jgi:hypothetical protein
VTSIFGTLGLPPRGRIRPSADCELVEVGVRIADGFEVVDVRDDGCGVPG